MALFVYSARERSGKKVEGAVEANDRRAALLRIEHMGCIPVSVEEKSAAAAVEGGPRFVLWRGRKERMGTRDVLTFTGELSDLLASGMRLGNALSALANRKSGKGADTIIGALRDDIIQGISLSEAMAKHPETFPQLYVSMIRAGEASGALPDVLSHLIGHYERLQEVKEKVTMAMIYPLIVMLMGVVTMIFAMTFVVPRFSLIFHDLEATLPLPTRILIAISVGLKRYGWLMGAGAGVVIVLIIRALRTDRGRFWWHNLQLKLPVVRIIAEANAYAQFAHTLGTLLAKGVPLLQALGIVEHTVTNAVVAGEIRNARDRVTDGTTISGPLAAGKIFPKLMTDMLAVGEQTGDVTGALSHIARRYENQLDRGVKVFVTVLEPLLIILMAFVVGFFALAMLLAVFDLTSGLKV